MAFLESTVKNALNAANPNTIADALKRVALGDLLSALATPITETLVVSSGLAITLSQLPVPGTLRITVDRAGTSYVQQESLHGTLTADTFNRSGLTVQLETTHVDASDNAYVQYTPLPVAQAVLDASLAVG